jgi:hypothetical protein
MDIVAPATIMIKIQRRTVRVATNELPPENKSACLPASSENDPRRYLVYRNWSSMRAAALLAKNMQMWLRVFGEDRAFRSLNDLSDRQRRTI